MKPVFYNDSPVFGGHEVMTLAGIAGLLESRGDPVICITAAANTMYIEELASLSAKHPHLTLETVPWHSTKFEAIRNRLAPKRAMVLQEILAKHQPSLVVAVQGNIEHSSLALHAARRMNVPSTSYLPVPHSHRQMGARLGLWRDPFCKHLFRMPDSFITVTEELANMLMQKSPGTPVHVVHNGIDTERFMPGGRTAAAACHHLPVEKVIFGVIGRIEFRQKQQHLLINAVASQPQLRDACHLVFCGKGPDTEALVGLMESHKVSGSHIPWCDVSSIYSAMDAIVIPSRYEGLPLVMLEALASGINVMGSDRDGMKDLLPDAMRFNPEKPQELTDTLIRFIESGCPPPPADLVSQVREQMSLENFKQAFVHALELAHHKP